MLEVHELIDCMGRDVFILRGALVGRDADGLQRKIAAGEGMKHAPGTVLDLREVASVDDDGARVLQAIAAAFQQTGVQLELCNAQGDVRARLRVDGDCEGGDRLPARRAARDRRTVR